MAAISLRRHSNLQCFLDSTTPSVMSHSLLKTSIRDLNNLWEPTGQSVVEYFNLADLWSLYHEWSAYGAGVPILFPGGETVLQYYVPYLSAIQIYTTKPLAELRAVGEDSESDSLSDDSEIERMSRSWDATSEDSAFDQDHSLLMNRLGSLYFHYVERCPPWGRIPLMDKVTTLSQSFPGLMSFKSTDLSPASWMSIAWYPIYHIPARRNAKDLSSSFLTFHTISSSFQENLTLGSDENICCSPVKNFGKRSKDTSNSISLPPFGLATYKMHGNLWINSDTGDHAKITNLYSSANSWLKQLRVHHHDFNFFITHAM
ncbi:hypothetical protein AXF42_Ash012562 [Apostasia shenzhenica]|uniref:Uncharacterized protein n=1 Tax=Apostasia shenzhenica TaxID=1088818 RepID=A0A2H9ZT07_9ASPA|nr:hypothetical protein AXF42_Ash012562 [Apostasia shenzhenica]